MEEQFIGFETASLAKEKGFNPKVTHLSFIDNQQQCKYCGIHTSQPEDECYKNPDNIISNDLNKVEIRK